MLRKEKTKIVDELVDVFSRSTAGVITDYRGLSVAEITALRGKLRETGVDFRVVKNTLARIATEKAGKQNLAEIFDGPTAVALGYGDITDPARLLLEYLKGAKESPLSIKSGFLGDQLLTTQQVNVLATLPDRDTLIAKLLGTMQAPVSNLVNGLAGIIRGMVNVLQARKDQLEKTA